MVKKYFEAEQPRAVYALGLHEGDVGKQLAFEYRRVTSHWLESTQPPIQKVVTRSVLTSERRASASVFVEFSASYCCHHLWPSVNSSNFSPGSVPSFCLHTTACSLRIWLLCIGSCRFILILQPLLSMLAIKTSGRVWCRQQFLFSRAKANWTRFSLEKEWFMGVVRLWQYGQSWESPATSLGFIVGLITFSFQPQLVVTGLLLTLMAYSLLTAPQRKEPPYEMRADPISDEGDDDEVSNPSDLFPMAPLLPVPDTATCQAPVSHAASPASLNTPELQDCFRSHGCPLPCVRITLMMARLMRWKEMHETMQCLQDADKGGITQLRQKYERLVRVALAVQIYLEESAKTLERLHGLVGWADPKATTIFLTFCLAVVLLMAAFSLPVVLSAALCWAVSVCVTFCSRRAGVEHCLGGLLSASGAQMRPPALRKPTPPAPLSFFTRLPTRSDEIV